ncbi:hypothetical protein [Gimesia aquarii]|uniref:Uncharacterized protein n=1 Tax=Gimesia aquarii TaxID=2527964 RepID=A0A517WVA8_9PLAN|nr:hypothetical protein [Gimesia aquarii]QDU09158.1 hypothetical protein V202x_25300 [Gimesia aquarii]
MPTRSLNSEIHLKNSSAPVILLLITIFLLNGCGSETYEQRLKETVKYFEYVDVRNQALSGIWSAPTIKMRIPIEFTQLEAPKKAPVTTSEEAPPEETSPETVETIDTRQPDYIDLELPGLEGAWRGEVPVDLDNEIVDRPAYLYVLSNNYLIKEKNMDEASDFHNKVLGAIAGTFNQFLNPDNQFLNLEEFTSERFPQGKGYTKAKSFLVGKFEPETQIEGVDYQFRIYLDESEKNQVVILLVIPKNISRGSKLNEHMDYSLETVDITSPQNSRGGQNSSSGRSSF